MSDPMRTVARGLVFSFGDFGARVHRLAQGTSDAQFWTRPYAYGNSMGHLVLHITGNLNYYIGAQIAGTGYVRDRNREFTDPAPPSKAEVLHRLDDAVEMVVATIEAQSADDWSAAYSAIGLEHVRDRFGIFLVCVTHFHHHVGQMIYLAKEHERQATDGTSVVAPIRYAHTNLVARNWRRLGSFYEQALGCTAGPERDLSGEWLARGTGVKGARVTGAHYRLPGGGPTGPTLEIFEYEPREDAAPPPANRVGFGHVAFAVADVEAAKAAVLAAGGSEVGTTESVAIDGAGRITWTYVRDPEGNIIELQRREA
jgi:glyoxylase I family protein